MIKFTKILKEDVNDDSFELDSKGNKLSKEQSAFFKDSKIRNKEGKLLVCYHGTIGDFKEFNSPINWFALSTNYSNQFANFRGVNGQQKTYEVYLNCKKFFNCGDTNSPVFMNNSFKPTLSPIISKLFSKLGLEGEEALGFIDKVVEERDKEGYINIDKEKYKKEMDVHIVTRTKVFKDLVQSKGYDSLTTIEEGYRCFGVFNANDIKYISNKNPTNSNNIDEALSKDLEDILINHFGTYSNVEEMYNDESMRCFVLLSGALLKTIDKESESYEHDTIIDYLKSLGQEVDFNSLYDLGWIKVNLGMSSIGLSHIAPTDAQKGRLEECLGLLYSNGEESVDISCEKLNQAQVYDFNEYSPKEVMGKISKIYLTNNLSEDIEKHKTLNPKLWNEDNTLKEEVRDKIKEIVDEFTNGLKQDGIKFDIKDIRLVGSNCSFNYTKDSDLDVHIIMKEDSLDCPYNLYPLIYSSYRSIFNKDLNIDFYGIPVEIYVEME